MILVRVRLISGRLNLTRRSPAREIKTGSGPEGAIDPRASYGTAHTAHRAHTARRCHTIHTPCIVLHV